MKAKVKATGEIVEVERISKSIYGRTDGIAMLYRKDVLDFNYSPQPEATISGWVARDKGGGLYLHSVRPRKGVAEWHSNHQPTPLPLDSFSSLTWQDEPIEVEITIKPKNNIK